MDDNGITLEELSERTGVEARTLRSWVSEGLLAPPFKPGRGARYPASNADRALAIRALKDLHGLSFSEIGRRFMMATDDQIREWALDAGPATTAKGSARDYLKQIKARSGLPQKRSADVHRVSSSMAAPEQASFEPRLLRSASEARGPSSAFDRQADLASIERLILELEKVLNAPAPRRSRGSIWTRISVTPDLELSIRGDLEPRERVLFEQLADQFRAILTGRAKHD
jgi:DNA-binding transcriptional MerR regulator